MDCTSAMKRSYSLCTWVSGGGSEGSGGCAALGPPPGVAFAPVPIPGAPPYIPAHHSCYTQLHTQAGLLAQGWTQYTVDAPSPAKSRAIRECLTSCDGTGPVGRYTSIQELRLLGKRAYACRYAPEERQQTWLLLLVGWLLGSCCVAGIGRCRWGPVAVPWRLAVRAGHWGIAWRRSSIAWWRHAIHLQGHNFSTRSQTVPHGTNSIQSVHQVPPAGISLPATSLHCTMKGCRASLTRIVGCSS